MAKKSKTPRKSTSNAKPTEAKQSLPMFYKAPVPLKTDEHGDLALTTQTSFAFAAESHVIPVMAAEFPQAIRSYPIVFAGDDHMPLAVTGFKAGQNLFVDSNGRWRAGHYIPAYVRRYPFILGGDETSENLTLCIDTASDVVAKTSDEGAVALIENGAPSDTTKTALRFCEEYQAMYRATQELAKLIEGQGLLVEQVSKVTLPDGRSHNVTGFKGVDEAKLRDLDDEAFLALRRTGALGAIYCQLASSNTWQSLLTYADAEDETA